MADIFIFYHVHWQFQTHWAEPGSQTPLVEIESNNFNVTDRIINKLTQTLVDSSNLQGKLISSETRSRMVDMIDFYDQPKVSDQPRFPRNTLPPLPPPHEKRKEVPLKASECTEYPIPHPFAVSLTPVADLILNDLEANLVKLLSLNPSRRESIALHLNRLTGLTPPSATGMGKADPNRNLTLRNNLPRNNLIRPGYPRNNAPRNNLQKWVEGPRTPQQNSALRLYLEEVTTIALGQAILLKSWSDRGIRKWTETDLGRLNWALSTTLKPQVPLDREGWQITRPNLYSWYNPNPTLQHAIWLSLADWRITDEGPNLLRHLLSPILRSAPENPEPKGYDSRFNQSLWKQIQRFGSEPISREAAFRKRNKVIFSPTLRDGSIVRSGPDHVTWVGLEISPFLLMMGELMQLWWGPAAPPLWTVGTGLEVHSRDQLALALCSNKPSVLNRIAEMESCDTAFVFEEQVTRANGRNANSHRFREKIENLNYFKKLRSGGTSLGALQACVALTKLRPKGILCWSRDEALHSKEGHETLNFLLEKAKLVCEWDFSDLEHSLPSKVPLFPKHLYLFQKEPNIEARHSHRPIKHSIHGQMRSHVELELMLEDALKLSVESGIKSSQNQTRGHWKIISHTSPTPQRDWIEKWPDPTCQTVIRQLDELRSASLPLANFTTIRPAPDPDSTRQETGALHFPLRGFWLFSESNSEGRRLITIPLSKQNLKDPPNVQGTSFLVLVSDESWVTPLATYVMSRFIHEWLEYHAERKGEKWILNEQVVKWLPVPKSLLRSLGVPNTKESEIDSPFATPLPGDWERLAAEVPYNPGLVQEELKQLPRDELFLKIHAAIFVRTSHALEYLLTGQRHLFSMVNKSGNIRWPELMEILPKSECVLVTLHPKIRLSGSLPPHLPIEKIEKVKSPSPGILLATESGFSLHLAPEGTVLTQIIWDQVEKMSHPTWGEIVQTLKLPRKVEAAEATALEVLRSYEEQIARYQELQELLKSCHFF